MLPLLLASADQAAAGHWRRRRGKVEGGGFGLTWLGRLGELCTEVALFERRLGRLERVPEKEAIQGRAEGGKELGKREARTGYLVRLIWEPKRLPCPVRVCEIGPCCLRTDVRVCRGGRWLVEVVIGVHVWETERGRVGVVDDGFQPSCWICSAFAWLPCALALAARAALG